MSKDGLAGRRVLVVEDDYLLATDLARLLRRAGAEVAGPVANVAGALGALEPPPDLACLDVRLGAEFSFPVADELARLGVPFIFTTGSGGEIPPAHRHRPLCWKPLAHDAVLQALAQALAAAPAGAG